MLKSIDANKICIRRSHEMFYLIQFLIALILLQCFVSNATGNSADSPTKELNSNLISEYNYEIIWDKSGKLVGWGGFDIKWIDFQQGIICTNENGGSRYRNKKVCLRNRDWEKISDWYDYISQFHEGLACYQQNNSWGYINSKGEVVIPARFHGAGTFSDGLASVTFLDKGGHNFGYYMMYINKSGKIAFPSKFCNALTFEDGIAGVRLYLEDKYESDDDSGYIDTKGYFVFKNNQFRQQKYGILSCYDGMVALQNQKGEIGFANLKGEIIFQPQFSSYIDIFCEGVALVEYNGFPCLIDNNGKIIKKVEYTRIGFFSEGLAPAELLQKDKNGNILARKVERQGFHSEGMPQDEIHDLQAYPGRRIQVWFIDRRYDPKIPKSFEDAQEFTNGLAAVKIDGKWGFIDKTGQIVIKPEYDWVEYGFDGQYALVIKNKEFINIDRQGNHILKIPEGFYPKSPIIFNRQILSFYPSILQEKLLYIKSKAE